jgi:hypothetical protein
MLHTFVIPDCPLEAVVVIVDSLNKVLLLLHVTWQLVCLVCKPKLDDILADAVTSAVASICTAFMFYRL